MCFSLYLSNKSSKLFFQISPWFILRWVWKLNWAHQPTDSCLLSDFFIFFGESDSLPAKFKNRILSKIFQPWLTDVLISVGCVEISCRNTQSPPRHSFTAQCWFIVGCGRGRIPALANWGDVVPSGKPSLGVRLHHHQSSWKLLWKNNRPQFTE